MSIKLLKDLFIANKPFTIEEASKLLELSLKETSRTLYHYKKQGHLYKVRRGLYLPVPHKGLSPEETFGDPWVIVPYIFPEGYVGGWTASNYWALTDQIFHTTCIITPKEIHRKILKIGRFEYALFKNSVPQEIGKELVWREQVQVPISDVHKTVIDMLENPICGAGIQHTIDCMKVYFQEFYDEAIFISYMQKIKTGVFFKRLGYITEVLLGPTHPLCLLSKERITKGYSLLDPSMICKTLITKWNLYINDEISL